MISGNDFGVDKPKSVDAGRRLRTVADNISHTRENVNTLRARMLDHGIESLEIGVNISKNGVLQVNSFFPRRAEPNASQTAL